MNAKKEFGWKMVRIESERERIECWKKGVSAEGRKESKRERIKNLVLNEQMNYWKVERIECKKEESVFSYLFESVNVCTIEHEQIASYKRVKNTSWMNLLFCEELKSDALLLFK